MGEVEKREGEGCDELLEYLDALYGYAVALTRNHAEAEDLVQDTYARAARHFARLDSGSNVKAWLFTIMRNGWRNQLRHERSGPEFVTFDDVRESRLAFDAFEDAERSYVRIWEREEIRLALETLTPAHRELIVLCDIEGFSYKEMAELVNRPVGTVMSRLARARAKLKSALLAKQRGPVARSAQRG